MTIDWKEEIVRVAYWKQRTAEVDVHKAVPWHLPSVAATPGKVAAAERSVGMRFAADYAEFLGYADGWKAFYGLVDLFGTDDFASGRSVAFKARPELHTFLISKHILPEDVIVMGASEVELDMFLLISETSPELPGGVIWFVSDEIERYSRFGDFFRDMANNNAQIAEAIDRINKG